MTRWVEQPELDLGDFPGVGTYEWLVQLDELRWSKGLLRLYGLTTPPAAEYEFTALVHPDDRVRVEAETSTFMGEGDSYAHQFRIVRPDGQVRLIYDKGTIERDSSAAVLAMRGINIDVTELHASEIKRAASQIPFKALAESLPQLVWTTNAAGQLDYYNSRIDEYAISPSDSGDWDWTLLIHPDDLAATEDAWRTSAQSHKDYSFSHRLKMADGSYRWHLSRAVHISGDEKSGARWFGTATDIDELRQAQEHRLLLLDELKHRIKNTLTLVQSVARLTFRDDAPWREQLLAFEARLKSMATAHDILTQRDWQNVSMRDLVESAIRSSGAAAERFVIKGGTVLLPGRHGVIMSMTIHELCTNAMKYGALSVPAGSVEIEWAPVSDNQEDFDFSWIECNGPTVTVPTRYGFGSRLINQALALQLQATVGMVFRPDGLHCSVRREAGI